ncbi:MAG TPA: penicillin-binding protein 1A [Burkholderiales bacterium]|nr:penicillin-binding protein 1A [Burkholderiales bacterium]
MKWLAWFKFPLAVLAGCAVITLLLLCYILLLTYPGLPSIDALADYRPKVPLRVYTADGIQIGEFGEERRAVVRIDEVPDLMKRAILAAEDERFYQHQGIDYVGVIRAAYSNLVTGDKRQGASTITMQVARNFFLSSEKTWKRKLNEALLAFKIERGLSKDQILELYINQIYLGQRAYGFAAASRTYFGKPLDQLSVAEAAILAGVPKAPSTLNPAVNPKRAKERQLYVLRRMYELQFLNKQEYEEAQKQPIRVKRGVDDFPAHAEYAAEIVRQIIYDRHPDDVYTKGYRVYTTLTAKDQEAAYRALRKGVLDYDRRHGYRGPEAYVNLPAGALSDEAIDEVLQEHSDSDDLLSAVVIEANAKQVKARRGAETLVLTGDAIRFVQSALSEKTAANKRVRRGAIIRVQQDEKGAWSVVQMPDAEAAFVSMDPQNGAVRALVGGFDFGRNKYNHVTQAWRQPGSSFKPFIYSAALEKGFTPATIFIDAPFTIDAALTGGQVWEPKNYDGKYDGPMRVRSALAKSKNMVSVRILRAIGPQYAQDYVTRFGFEAERHPPYLTMALGAGSVTAWQMVRAYGVFANGGYRLEPYLIEKVVDDRGNVLLQSKPQRAGDESLRVIDLRNAYIMDSMMHDVVRYGTAARAASLGRQDLAGKTGTTNDNVDAWFAGYSPALVAVSWIGFDQPKKLGANETGSVAALPIWMGYMEQALKGVPERQLIMPEGVVAVQIDPNTGLQSAGGMTEYFYQEFQPRAALPPEVDSGGQSSEEVQEQLF